MNTLCAWPWDTDHVHEWVALYAVDALEPVEQAAFEAHLPGCPWCAVQIAGYAEVTARLAQAVARHPPPALRRSVLEAVHHARALVRAAQGAHGRWAPSARSRQQLTTRDDERVRHLLSASDVAVHRIEVEGRAAAVVVSREAGTALFVAPDLLDPGPGREYQLWLIDDGGPVPDVTVPGGRVRTWLAGNVAGAGAIAVTVEPAGGSTTPTWPALAAAGI
ncbi:anti-sigma factor [Kocuria sp. KH4]